MYKIRRLARLGRVTIPIKARRVCEIYKNDPVEFLIDGENIVLKKYRPSCIICEQYENLITFKNKPVCIECCNSATSVYKKTQIKTSDPSMLFFQNLISVCTNDKLAHAISKL